VQITNDMSVDVAVTRLLRSSGVLS